MSFRVYSLSDPPFRIRPVTDSPIAWARSHRARRGMVLQVDEGVVDFFLGFFNGLSLSLFSLAFSSFFLSLPSHDFSSLSLSSQHLLQQPFVLCNTSELKLVLNGRCRDFAARLSWSTKDARLSPPLDFGQDLA